MASIKKDEDHDHEEYVNFLKEIGYLLDEGKIFKSQLKMLTMRSKR